MKNEDDFTKYSKVSQEFPLYVVRSKGRKLTLWVEQDETVHSVYVKLWDELGTAYDNDSVR